MLTISETSALLGVSEKTLRFWDASGFFVARHTAGGHRRYDQAEVTAIQTVFLNEGKSKERREDELRLLCRSEYGKDTLLKILQHHMKMEPGTYPKVGTLLVQTIMNLEYPT